MKDWHKRAIRTFGQSAIGYIVVGIPSLNYYDDMSAMKTAIIGLAISAVATGISAVMNILDEKKGGKV